jgi:hypothetical protein
MSNVAGERITNDLSAVTDSEDMENSANVHNENQISGNESITNAEFSEGNEKIAADNPLTANVQQYQPLECSDGIGLPDNNDSGETQADAVDNALSLPECINVHPDRSNNSGPSPLTFQTLSVDETIQKSTAGVVYEQVNGGFNISVPTTVATRMISNIDEKTYRLGYDSDGEIGPFFDAVQHEMEYDDECSSLVSTEPAVANPAENASEGVPTEQTARAGHAPPPPTIVSEEAIRMMTVPALKDELGRRGLSKSGVKAVLIERLLPQQSTVLLLLLLPLLLLHVTQQLQL